MYKVMIRDNMSAIAKDILEASGDIEVVVCRELTKKFEEIRIFYETLKTMVDSHEQKMNKIDNGYSAASNLIDKMDSSFKEMKKTVYEVQKRPYEIDNKMRRMEEQLELTIHEKYSRQKNFSYIILLILIATIFFIVIAFPDQSCRKVKSEGDFLTEEGILILKWTS